MKQVSKITLCLLCMAMALTGCRDKVRSKADTAAPQAAVSQSMKRISKVEKQGDMRQYDVADKQRITDFIPKGYKLFEKISGDLNKDGLEDCVLIIKATRKDGFERDYEGKLIDRNRRGIIVLFSEEKGYKVAVKNYNCFSSENEDGGVYFAPYLSIDIRNSICTWGSIVRYYQLTCTIHGKSSKTTIVIDGYRYITWGSWVTVQRVIGQD